MDCIWLLPFFKSPLRDGGYDISDFFQIQPDYGTVDDVRDFIEAAHQRGIRVIADLVMNHTSSRSPVVPGGALEPGQPQARLVRLVGRPDRYSEARIIFTDTETSNWTWDDQAQAYYWHRFFSHQPDLNFDNPEVQEAMLEVLRFWLDLGMDGFRLDAVPYLYERDGTNGENLPETHAYLKRVRAEIDRLLPGPRAAGRGQPVAGRRRRVLRRRRRVPHGLPLPGHAAHVHGGAARGGQPDLRDPRARRRASRTTASGACSCATTTS